jgi:hypothetical protein
MTSRSIRPVDRGVGEVDGCTAVAAAGDLGEFVLGSGEADPQPLELADPAFPLSLGDAGDEVVADVGQPCPLGRVRSEERASDTGLTEMILE